MNGSIILLRVIHIVCGTFWVGAVFMTVLFLMKAIADVGPTGGQVMGALVKRRYFDFLPVMALLTVLSGIDLLRRVSGGFRSEYMGSRAGIVLSVGALAGLLALAIGVFVSRPSTMGAIGLMGKAMAMADGPEKAALLGQVAARRARGADVAQDRRAAPPGFRDLHGRGPLLLSRTTSCRPRPDSSRRRARTRLASRSTRGGTRD